MARIGEILALEKGSDRDRALATVQSEFPTVADFERNFPSLCFALATGVGKTRLMGAFISYLHRVHQIRHFFVLAPNLTIYNKLITDFTPNTPKYVFQGIAEFANHPPEIITGDNYASGRGVRDEARLQMTLLRDPMGGNIHVNIFNISKINSEVRGGKAPRIKRLSEYIGESYFDYLAKLDDLVLLMDESHRYRASAGVRAINELNPVLGLELTATPQVESGKNTTPFKNVLYSYPLANAMDDGYVKEPAVATRENFNVRDYSPAELERLKLTDGVRIHEHTKVELEIYARDHGRAIVKPFMLVVAQDTEHAEDLVRLMAGDDFFEGRYKGKVITVHSNKRGEEKDENVAQLLSVEDRENPIEIVIHVNMLKEGWDVTNLYTIVPLRAANSRTLVEQSIGRGLRLPYGKRTGVAAVDRLTIVSHDRFQEIIDEANSADSIIRTGIVIGKDIPDEGQTMVEVEPVLVQRLTGQVNGGPPVNSSPSLYDEAGNGLATNGADSASSAALPTPPVIYPLREERLANPVVVRKTLESIVPYETLPRSADLRKPEIQEDLVTQVMDKLTFTSDGTGQYTLVTELDELPTREEVAQVVAATTNELIERTIDIPRIVVMPTGDVTSGYRDFTLDVAAVHLQPVEQQILIQHLHDNDRHRLTTDVGTVAEERPENYLVRSLMDFDDINYDEQAGLLYGLAGQMVAHLRSYLPDADAVENVLQYHEKHLAQLIHSQMQDHYEEQATDYEVTVSKGFKTIEPMTYAVAAGEAPRHFRTTVANRQEIRQMVFGGFARCVYPYQKFDSDTERRFAVLLENETDTTLKWVKPGRKHFQIYYTADDAYEPDFVIETATAKLICEPKRASDMADPVVQAKAKAAATWCKNATAHARQHGDKPWRYLLIPHDAIGDQMTLAGLAGRYRVTA